MKRIYISILFLTIAFLLSAVELGYVSGKADVFISIIDQTDRYMRKTNYEDALNLCREVEDEWYETAESIDMLLIHDYVDEIGNSISKMRSHAENGNPDLYFSESASAKKELASIKESEYPLLENIF